MVIKKIENHMASNKRSLKQIGDKWMGKYSLEPLSKDSLDRINTMENKAVGYIARFGDKAMLTKTMSQDIKSEDHLFLLLNLGMAVDKKDIAYKALSSSGSKNADELSYLKAIKEDAEKEVKEWLIKVDSYYLNKRLTQQENNDLEVEQDYSHKTEIINNPLVEKGLSLKMNPLMLQKLQPKPKAILIKKPEDDLEEDFDSNLDNTEIYAGYLDEERIQQEIEVVARREFQLKEVASTQLSNSLDGDIPRAVVTDLSFNAIDNIVNSIDQRFNTPKAQNKELSNKSKNKDSNGKKVSNIDKPLNLKMDKPTPNKFKNLQGKNSKQLAMAMRAQQKTIEISKKFMFGQENHMNYIDVERFELDEMQGRNSVYEAGAKNPLSGRIISSKVKNQFSDLRMDSTFKIRR